MPLLSEHAHSVLRLPPYHPDLNPIELIWALVKNYVATHNVTFNVTGVCKIAVDKFNNVEVEEWKNIVNT
jgi:transposase